MMCPCCHQKMMNKATLTSLVAAPLPTVARTIVNGLAAAYPKSVTGEALIASIYNGVRGGGPVNARTALSVQMARLRDKLPMYGWTIPRSQTGKGNLARYRLCPLADMDEPIEEQG